MPTIGGGELKLPSLGCDSDDNNRDGRFAELDEGPSVRVGGNEQFTGQLLALPGREPDSLPVADIPTGFLEVDRWDGGRGPTSDESDGKEPEANSGDSNRSMDWKRAHSDRRRGIL